MAAERIVGCSAVAKRSAGFMNAGSRTAALGRGSADGNGKNIRIGIDTGFIDLSGKTGIDR
jgi:hypothetical protein